MRAAHSQVTRVYDVPGNKLILFADGIAGQGSDGMDLLIYGSK
jgi:type III secretion protein HrpB1